MVNTGSSALRSMVAGAALLGTVYAVGSCLHESQHSHVADQINGAAERVVSDEDFQRDRVIRKQSSRYPGGTVHIPDFKCYGDRLVDARDTYAEDNGLTADRLIMSERGYLTESTDFDTPWNLFGGETSQSFDATDEQFWDINVNALEDKGFKPVEAGDEIRRNSEGFHVYEVEDDYKTIGAVVDAANQGDIMDWYEPVSTAHVTDVDGDMISERPAKDIRRLDAYVLLHEKEWTQRSSTSYDLPSLSFHGCHN